MADVAVGAPVRLRTRMTPPARILPILDGIVQSIDGDRAWVRWSDGAISSARIQFLDPSIGWYPAVVHILTQSADLHDRDRQTRRGLGFNSGELHLRASGHWPSTGPTMRPDELED